MAASFFEQQQDARRQTRTLIILFVFAVVLILLAVNGVLATIWRWTNPVYSSYDGLHAAPYPRGFFWVNSFLTLLFIGGGTLFEMFNLRDGGAAVAKMAGGRLIPPDVSAPLERRLLNVVEEMSLASGIARPQVYVLDREDAINAFAAGYNANEAVVAVTRGTLERLTRDELQGVVAHEFSHILNGDMRLNIGLIGVLFGIQMMSNFGSHLLDFGARIGRSGDSSEKTVPLGVVLMAMGVALFVIGYIGVFFGRLIKAAVSRQREFLADASAVQFTRNPETIGGALRKIGGFAREGGPGSRIAHPNAEQLSHLFLGAAKPRLLSGMFATHPPIEERIQRVYGRRMELLAAPELDPPVEAAADRLPDLPYVATGFAEAAAVAALPVAGSISTGGTMRAATAGPGPGAALPVALSGDGLVFGNSAGSALRLPAELEWALRDPWQCCALAYAVLLGEGENRAAQLPLLEQGAPKQAAHALRFADLLQVLPRSARLPLLDLAMPGLRSIVPPERARFLALVEQLIAADQRVSLAEFVVQTVLEWRLAPTAGRAVPVKYKDIGMLRDDAAVLLALVAHIAARSGAPAAENFMRGAAMVPAASLTVMAMPESAAIGFARVRAALERANQLAPLEKALLVKCLLGAGTPGKPLAEDLADLLRAICSALDVPAPAAVAATYTPIHINS